MPASFPRAILVVPALALLLTGLVTLPREGVAAQDRAAALLEAPNPVRPMLRRLVWLGLTVLLLLPRAFLGAYGIPHLNPLTGLILPDWQRRLALGYLLLTMLAPILYLRSSKLYAPAIRARRPRDLRVEDGTQARRDALLFTSYALLPVWALLLRPFWTPFSLLEWPPGLDSLTVGVRGVAAISFAVTIPIILFMSLAAHLHLLRRLWGEPPSPKRSRVAALALVHALLIVLALVLHAYDLLWIARYEALARF